MHTPFYSAILLPGIAPKMYSQTRAKREVGNSLVVQWLGLDPFTAGAWGLIPGRGTKIPQAGGGVAKKKKKEREKSGHSHSLSLVCSKILGRT